MTSAIGWTCGSPPISVSVHLYLTTFVRLTKTSWFRPFTTLSSAGTVHTCAEALLMLIESSPEPLVSPLEDECLYADTFAKCCDLIRILSSPKKNVFLYICLFLQELLKNSQFNRLDAAKLGEHNRSNVVSVCRLILVFYLFAVYRLHLQLPYLVVSFCLATEALLVHVFGHWAKRKRMIVEYHSWWNS